MEGFQNFNTNFDPNGLAQLTSDVIQIVCAIDVSPSITSFVNEMNTAMNGVFMNNLRTCHRADDIVIKGICFDHEVTHKSGFLPLANLQDDYLNVTPSGYGTKLYGAVLESLQSAVEYREKLELQGINVRTSIFIITDGEDNRSSGLELSSLKDEIKNVAKNEAWATNFTFTMLGIGDEDSFKHSCVQMGLNPDVCLVTISNSEKEIRDKLNIVSQSMSSSQQATSFVL